MNVKTLKIILAIILLFVAVGALPAGYAMMVSPDGKALGMSLDFLKNSPFNSFLIPGIFLFFINGLCSLFIAILAFLKHKLTGIFGLLLGIFLVLWIIIQILSISETSFMQPMFLGIGIIEILISIIIIKKEKKTI